MSSAVIYPKSWIPYNVRTLLCRFFFDVCQLSLVLVTLCALIHEFNKYENICCYRLQYLYLVALYCCDCCRCACTCVCRC